MQQPQAALNIGVSPLSDWQKWGDYADKNDSNPYHDSRWSLLIQQTLVHKTYYLCAERTDKVVGILPLLRVKHRIFGDYLVSLPFITCGDVLADTPSIAASVTKARGDAHGAKSQRQASSAGRKLPVHNSARRPRANPAHHHHAE